MSSNREWMYTTRASSGHFNPAFQSHVKYFLNFAYANATNIRSRIINGVNVLEIRCPCATCQNREYKSRDLVEYDLYNKGFMKDYLTWYCHGVSLPSQDTGQCSNPIPSQHLGDLTRCDQMVMESMHQNQHHAGEQGQQAPNRQVEAFYTMLRQADEPLWDGCEKASTLSITTRLLHWKSECNISDSAYDKLLPIVKDCLPEGEKLPRNFYETKKMLKPLELPSQQIHVCKNHCMLFNGQFSDLDHCTVCMASRYKQSGNKVPELVMTYMPIGPRIQRLFYSKKTAKHLTWHADHQRQPEKMSHPSEGRAWNHFDSVFPDFAQETCHTPTYGGLYIGR